MATSITGKPDKKVKNLTAPKRGSGNRKMTSTWDVPSSMIKSDYSKRATDLVVKWKFAMGIGKKELAKTVSTSKKESTINLSSLTIGRTTYTRSSFYPVNQNNKLSSVTVAVKGKNSKGEGEPAIQTRKFEVPRKPTIDFIEFNGGTCSTTIRTDAGADHKERYDTYYRVTVTDRNGSVGVPTSGVTVISGQTSYTEGERALTSTEFTVSYDYAGYQSLTDNEFVRVNISAWARGFAGDSKIAEQDYYISRPQPATISNPSVSSKDSNGMLTIEIDTNQSTEHPVDTVRLEYLANVPYESESDIPSVSWSDSGVEDNGTCTALTMPVSDIMPSTGNHSWVRVASIHSGRTTYSNYLNIDDLHTPASSVASSDIKILSATAGDNGDTAKILLGWNTSGEDPSTGTELSWADDENTWRSTKEPNRYEFDWSDGELTVDGVTYHDSAEIIIMDLQEGQKYYVMARRFTEDEATIYGDYSNMATVIPNEKPISVVASCKKFITEGDPLNVYWTFSGTGVQTAWQIVDSEGAVILNGEGSAGSAQISATDLAEHSINNALTFVVKVSTGSDFVTSDSRMVKILEKPTLSVSAPSTLTAQPYSFTATSSRLCDLIVIVTAQGATGQFPEGTRIQANGDTVHSDVYSPSWSSNSATITLPENLDFWDGASYTLSVVAVDRETNLRSDEATSDTVVSWTNKAVDPDGFARLVPLDYLTDGGEHIQAVEIHLTQPTGSRASDVYDIYRMDGAKANLIGEGFPLDCTATDLYAPFSVDDELFYRIALRTVDGDVEFTDKSYTLESETVRFDWQGGSLELPYGITIGDNYKKDVEFRQHMDGSTEGYWNPNIERGASYSSSIIKLIQPEEINLARQLARYAGAVFVRTANGSAFTADVQVSDMSVKNKAVTAIAIDATEVGMTEEFMLESPYELEDE